MFLLILMMESQQQKSFHTLNSIMFLLIRDCGIYCSFVKNFKFHYVSINSLLQQLAQQLWLSLNSIMFLLIHFTDETYFDEHPYFKFHYVSINSINPIASHIMLLFFKFHYVSINSEQTEETFNDFFHL